MHRVRINLSDYSYESLLSLFLTSFSTLPKEFVIQYFQADGGRQKRCVISDAASLNVAVVAHLDSIKTGIAKPTASIRFLAQSKASATLYETTLPLLTAIETLLAQLTLAMKSIMNKAKQENWEGGLRRSLSSTGDFISKAAKEAKQSMSGCKDQVDAATVDFISQATDDAKRSIALCKDQVEALPMDKMLQDTTECLKVAAMEISSFASEFAKKVTMELETVAMTPPLSSMLLPATISKVETSGSHTVVPTNVVDDATMAPLSTSTATPPAAPLMEVVAEQQPTIIVCDELALVAAIEDDIENDSSSSSSSSSSPSSSASGVSSDGDWSVLSSPEEKATLYAQWGEQIDQIRTIFPECDLEDTCHLLTRFQGEVNAVLNALAEL